MSVLICIPTYESIAAETFKSVYDQEFNKEHGRPLFDFIKGYGCAQARNKAAKEALECGVDYLMFVDSDVILPSNALNCLLEYDSDICVGIYPRRNTSCGQTEVFLNTSYNFYDDNNLNLNSIPSDTRIDVKGGGLGCACIKTSVFKKLEYPYFRYVEYDDGATLSEDNYFCWKAAEAGAKIQCDTRVRCKHKSEMWLSA